MSIVQLSTAPAVSAMAFFPGDPRQSPGTSARGAPVSMRSNSVRRGRGPLAGLMRGNELYPVFQPIVSLRDGSIYSHEALIRGPKDTSLHAPDALLAAAAHESLNYEFENVCVTVALDRWGTLLESGRLFVNVSAEVLVQVLKHCGRDALMDLISGFGVLPRMLVLEITEYERVADMDHLASVVREIRSAGVSLALDDFGDGRSSLRLCHQFHGSPQHCYPVQRPLRCGGSPGRPTHC